MLIPLNLILIGGGVLSAYALPTLPARFTTSRIVARQNPLLTEPTTVNTSRSFTTSFGPMVEVCVVTLTPITAPNGVAAVEEVRACTVGIQPANNAGGGGAPSNTAPPAPVDSAAPPAPTDSTPPAPASPADSAAPPAATDSGLAPAPTDSAALPAASNSDPFAPTPSDAASSIEVSGASSDGAAAPTPVSDGGTAPSDASGSAAPATTDAAGAASSGVPQVIINPVSTVNAADLPGFSAAPAASAVASGSDAAGASASATPADSAAPLSTDAASVSPVDAGATPSASAAAAEQSAPADDGTPGRTFSVLPIGLGVFAGISAIALIVVGLVTYERTKYRKAFRQRKLAEAGANMAYGGMAQRT